MPSYGWSTIDEFQLYAGPSKVQFLNTFSNTSALSLSEFREAGQSRMLDVRGNVSIVSPYAIVISSTPLALLDLAGGCCRPAAPISPLDRSLKPYIKADLKGGWKLSQKRKRVDYEWVYLACHSHSKTYFHGVLEAAPKLLWGLRLLHANPSVRVLHDSRHVSELLPVLNLTGRGIVYNEQRGVSANRVTIPPPAQLTAGLVKALRRFSFAHVRLREPEAWRGSNSVIVVRRDVIATDGGRAMLNHDELMFALRFRLLSAKSKLAEWAPTGTSFRQAIQSWAGANVAIAPHGAGLTNMIFMPPGSKVIEIIAEGQRGQVYGTLAKKMGHSYVSCYYRHTQPAVLRIKPSAGAVSIGGRSSAFHLNLRFIQGCLRKAGL